jgi:hypothetical protein
MREIIEDEQLQNQYRSKSINRALEFDVSVIIRDYKQIIDSFLP